MAGIDKEFNPEFQEPAPPGEHHKPERRSSLSKIVDAVKKPFHHSHKERKENPPALQDAIDKMEARKENMQQQMEQDGKDPNVLSGNRVDIMKSELGSGGTSDTK